MKKYVKIILTIILILSLSACGKSTDSKEAVIVNTYEVTDSELVEEYFEEEKVEKFVGWNHSDAGINDLDEFYNTELTRDKDIRKLPKEYSSSEAQLDNCFVIGAMVHNDHLYTEFVNDSGNKKSAFIRVAQNTVEGDLLLKDILYDERSDRFYLVRDYSRDSFASGESKVIQMKEYAAMAEYEYQNGLYWVLYTGELNDDTFENGEVFVIAFIN